LAGVYVSQCGYDNRPEAQTLPEAGCAPGYVLATGTLTATDSELMSGYFVVDNVTLLTHPDGITALRLKTLRGEELEVIVRQAPPKRELRPAPKR